MKKIVITFFSTAYLFILASGACYSDERIFRVGIQDNDGSPLIMGNGATIGNPPGIGVDIIIQVAKDLDLNLEIVREPNKRVHNNFRKGAFDGSGFYSFKESRKKEGVYPTLPNGKLDKSKRIFIQGYYMYAPKGHSITWDGKTITGVKYVGANLGYSVVSVLKKLGIKVNEAKTIKQNLGMLSKNRIQAYAAQDAALDPIIASYDEYSHLVKVGPAIRKKEYYFMFSHQYYKKHKKMAEKIWNRIEEVRNSVIAKYKKMNIRPVLK